MTDTQRIIAEIAKNREVQERTVTELERIADAMEEIEESQKTTAKSMEMLASVMDMWVNRQLFYK